MYIIPTSTMTELGLLNLPDIVVEKIFSYLLFDEVSQLRIVCKHFDTICKQLLNKGFVAAERFHSQSLKAVKVQLPRRESERRLHPMARHCDILTAIETRLSMLSMTFMKYVDVGLCCFIPGKVIDEIFKVLRFLKETKSPPRAHEILQELRDISCMAMEHFEEKIAPALKKGSSLYPTYSLSGTSSMPDGRCQRYTQETLRIEFQKIQYKEQRNRMALNSLRSKVKRQSHQLSLQTKKLHNQASRIAQQEAQIAEMKRTLVEWDHKFSDIVAELSSVVEEKVYGERPLSIPFSSTDTKDNSSVEQPSENNMQDTETKKRALCCQGMMSFSKRMRLLENTALFCSKRDHCKYAACTMSCPEEKIRTGCHSGESSKRKRKSHSSQGKKQWNYKCEGLRKDLKILNSNLHKERDEPDTLRCMQSTSSETVTTAGRELKEQNMVDESISEVIAQTDHAKQAVDHNLKLEEQ